MTVTDKEAMDSIFLSLWDSWLKEKEETENIEEIIALYRKFCDMAGIPYNEKAPMAFMFIGFMGGFNRGISFFDELKKTEGQG